MATRAGAVERLRIERRFFVGIAAALVVATFIGFAPTYYLAPSTARPLSTLTHVHGAAFTAWMLLFLIQTGLVAADRRDLHRAIGPAAAVLAVAIVVLGVDLAIVSGRAGTGPRIFSPRIFLIFPLTAIGLFAVFATIGIVKRRDPQAHKRWMLLAMIAMVVPALARIAIRSHGLLPPGVIGGMMLSDLFLIALGLFDLRTRGRLHPVTLWGGGALLLSEPLRLAIGLSAPWQAFAALLIG